MFVALSKSNGCVQQAAPALARPPKYHRPIRLADDSEGMAEDHQATNSEEEEEEEAITVTSFREHM